MPHRTIVDTDACEVCASIAAHDGSTDLFMRGYIAGRRAIMLGTRTEENFCSAHDMAAEKMVAAYVGAGVKTRKR